jgi:uncharacterized membrane protein YphA (DoxX/SURF4 family)
LAEVQAFRPDWSRYALLWVRMAFGAHSAISGLNHFVPIFDIGGGGDPALSPIGPIMGELIHVGLYDLVKVIELVVGICLLTNRFVPLAAAVELPISAVIAYLCIVVDGTPHIIFSGVREIGFNLFILACYADYFLPLITANARVRPIWQPPFLRSTRP